MIRLPLFLLFCVFCVKIACTQDPKSDSIKTPNDQFSEKSNALLEECISYKESVGIVAGLSEKGTMVWKGSAGYMDLENEIPANPNMLHRIASLAKPMTAIAVLQLYEKGGLNLDDEVQKYLPDFPSKKGGAITVRHLLQHTSGISAYASYDESAPLKDYPTLSDALAIFENRPLSHVPGTEYSYTTYGYVVLGAIVEKVSKLSFRNYMKENIWDKAGMLNTDVEVFGKHYENKSKLYFKNSYGGLVLDRVTNLSSKIPGGGFYSTVDDLLKFGNAVLENKLIKSSTLDLMITDAGIKQHGNPYAMGWFLYANGESENGRIIGHTGSQSGVSCYFQIFLDKKIVVVTLSNTAEVNNFVIDVSTKLTDGLIHPEKINKPLKSRMELSVDESKVYAGQFKKEDRTIRVFTEHSNLFVTINNRFKTQLHPTSIDHFFVRWGDTDYKFVRDDKEQIDRLIIIENGNEASYSKIIEKPSLAKHIKKSISQGDMDLALELLQPKYANVFNSDTDTLIQIGYELIENKNSEFAVTYFSKLSERFPKVLAVYDGLGKAKLELGAYVEARALFMKAAPIRANDGFYQMAIDPAGSYAPTEISKDSRALFEYRGGLDNSTVFIFLQGGPDPFLSIDNGRDPFFQLSNRDDLLRVYPYQSQMLNHSMFSPNSQITYEEAAFERQQSAEIIYQTVEYFKKQGKEVCLFAHSFGAQLTLEYLESKPNNADRIILMGARLDSDINNYPDLPPGKLIRWEKGIEPFVSTWYSRYPAMPLIQNDFYQVINNSKQLINVHRNKKFSSLLKDKKLDNITFFHAKFDEASGRQNEKELNFLRSNGTTIIGTYGDHHSMLTQYYISDAVNAILEGESIKPSLAFELSNRIENGALASALERYNALNKETYSTIESELNALGYDLVNDKKLVEATEIFKINVASFPNSWNTYDSLGEIYMVRGKNNLAIENYKKSLRINPTNNFGIEALKRLKPTGNISPNNQGQNH